MQIRGLTRLTNAVGQKMESYRAAIALRCASYKRCRTHGSLRVTTEMEVGLTDRVWTVDEVLIT